MLQVNIYDSTKFISNVCYPFFFLSLSLFLHSGSLFFVAPAHGRLLLLLFVIIIINIIISALVFCCCCYCCLILKTDFVMTICLPSYWNLEWNLFHLVFCSVGFCIDTIKHNNFICLIVGTRSRPLDRIFLHNCRWAYNKFNNCLWTFGNFWIVLFCASLATASIFNCWLLFLTSVYSTSIKLYVSVCVCVFVSFVIDSYRVCFIFIIISFAEGFFCRTQCYSFEWIESKKKREKKLCRLIVCCLCLFDADFFRSTNFILFTLMFVV